MKDVHGCSVINLSTICCTRSFKLEYMVFEIVHYWEISVSANSSSHTSSRIAIPMIVKDTFGAVFLPVSFGVVA